MFGSEKKIKKNSTREVNNNLEPSSEIFVLNMGAKVFSII